MDKNAINPNKPETIIKGIGYTPEYMDIITHDPEAMAIHNHARKIVQHTHISHIEALKKTLANKEDIGRATTIK